MLKQVKVVYNLTGFVLYSQEEKDAKRNESAPIYILELLPTITKELGGLPL